VWQKWASRDMNKAAGWAAIPKAPKIVTVVPAADQVEAKWHFTTNKPQDDWSKPGFNDSTWKESAAGFGARGTPGAVIKTTWRTSDIWIRRQFEIPAVSPHLQLWMHHDEDAEVFINGVSAAHVHGFTGAYEPIPLQPAGLAAIKSGTNLIAIHCHQTTGGQYIDAGFVEVENSE
jgi:hypothetical protein